MSDFYGGGDFKKGKSKTLTLKPWQSQGESGVAQTKKRCWDGLLGCEQYKSLDEFKLNKLICRDCVNEICDRYQILRPDHEYLFLLIWQDSSLYKSAKTLGANEDKLDGLRKAQEIRIKELFAAVQKTWKNQNELKRLNRTYRKWFYEQAGVNVVENNDHVKGFSSVGVMV